MRSFFAISCRSVNDYHLKPQTENLFIRSLHSIGNWKLKKRRYINETHSKKRQKRENLNQKNPKNKNKQQINKKLNKSTNK